MSGWIELMCSMTAESQARKWDPLFKNLRGDPRYIALLKRLHLPL